MNSDTDDASETDFRSPPRSLHTSVGGGDAEGSSRLQSTPTVGHNAASPNTSPSEGNNNELKEQ